MFKYKYSKLYWFLRNFEFLKVYFSPFKLFLPKLFFGKTKIGVPYFLPRNMKLNKETRYYEFSEKKIGFSFCGLGWKTKYDSIRFEWNPVWSFVALGYQIALIFVPENCHHYWESYLYYTYATDKSKSTKERVKEAQEKFPCKWSSYSGDKKVTTDYWTVILKNKYLSL